MPKVTFTIWMHERHHVTVERDLAWCNFDGLYRAMDDAVELQAHRYPRCPEEECPHVGGPCASAPCKWGPHGEKP